MKYEKRLDKSKTFSEIFEIVKDVVEQSLGLDQAGIMIGVSDLGEYPHGFVGAYYSVNSNTIVINKRPIGRLLQTNPKIYNHYLFHIILHEYLHSVGITDEDETRRLVYELSKEHFDEGHTVTQLALDIQRFVPLLSHPQNKYIEPEDIKVEFVKGIDKKNINYIG